MNYAVSHQMCLVLLMIFWIAGLNEWGKDHNEMLEKVLHVCRQVNLKFNKEKYLFRNTRVPSFGGIISWKALSLEPRKVQALTDMLPPKTKKELQSFLGIINYQSRFSKGLQRYVNHCQSQHQYRLDME